jgi:Na+/H+ antiporter NhaD/arsenite permease-like protein
MKWLKNIILFYYQGFKNMTVGKTLWVIILVKLFILFAIFRIFFFKDFLESNFNSDRERSNHVIEEITK